MKTPSLLEAAATCDAWCEQRLKANYDARSENRRLKAEASLATESETAPKIPIEQHSQKPMPQVRRENNTTEYREVCANTPNWEDCQLELPPPHECCTPEPDPLCGVVFLAGSVVFLAGWLCVHIYKKCRAAGVAQGPSMSNVCEQSGSQSGTVSESDSVPPSSSVTQEDPASSCTLYEVD
jgi:hypothetical protein